MRIEIVGGMGVGKTTFCQALVKQNLNCVFENLETNPYLELSYQDPKKYGFYSQISFVLGNFHTSAKYADTNDVTFFDYSTLTDRAYASVFLRGKARIIALQMIDYLEEKEGMADIYLHLSCNRDEQLRRIKSRQRDYEKRVGPKFVEKLEHYVSHYINQAEKKGARIIRIDTDSNDFHARNGGNF